MVSEIALSYDEWKTELEARIENLRTIYSRFKLPAKTRFLNGTTLDIIKKPSDNNRISSITRDLVNSFR